MTGHVLPPDTYRALFDSIDEGFCVIEMIGGDHGEPIDYRFLEINAAFERQTGLVGAVGRRMRELAPQLEGHWFDRFDRIARTQRAERFDRADALGRSYDVHASPVDDPALRRVAVFFRDVVGRKHNELSEARYRMLFETMDEGFVVGELVRNASGTPIDFRYLELNPVVQQLVGWDPRVAVGRLMSEMIPETEIAYWIDNFAAVIASGRSSQSEQFHQSLDGWFRANTNSIGSDRVAVVYQNITAQKRAAIALRESEERQAFLLRLGDALRAESSVDAVADRALRMLFEQLQLDRCFVAIYDLPGDRGDIPQQVGNDRLPPLPASVRLSDFPEAFQIALDRTVVIDNVATAETLSDFDQRNLTALGLGGVVAASLRRGESTPIWAIVACSATPRRWSAAEIALIEETAERTWAAIERTRAEAALRESEARLSAAFESVPVGLAVLAKTGDVILANAGYRRFIASEHVGGWQSWDGAGSAIGPDHFPGARSLRGETVFPGMEMLYTGEDGREVWTRVATVPTFDGNGAVTGMVSVISDIDELKRSADALRESRERLSLAVEVGQFASWDWDMRSGAVRWNDRHYLLQGYSVGEVTPSFEAWLARLHPEGRVEAVAAIERARDAKQLYAHEFRTLSPEGVVRWCNARGRFFEDAAGNPVRMIGVMEDVTERKRSEAALRESEERLRKFGEASQDVLWIRDAETLQCTYLTPAFETIYGLERETALSGDNYRRWLDMVEPDDRQLASDHIARVRAGEQATFEYRIRRAGDGAIRWLRDTSFPITDDDGNVILIAGIGHDITDRREAEGRQMVLLAELQHRVRNILALLRSIVRRSNDGERSADDYVQHLEGRISALARTQILLTRRAGAGVNLEEMIRDELAAQAARDQQFSITGPDVDLSPKAAEVLTLAIHELATNATKYGAFARRSGRLAVAWRVDVRNGQQWLDLHWKEAGVPIVEPVPRREGFGTELISRRIPYELKGSGSFELRPGGLESRIEFPLRPGDSILQTDGVSA